jgi:GT2 family glycosyltransferase
LPSYLCSLSATRDYGAVTAALMVMPRSLFSKLNGFDESLSVGFNDTDLCLRAGKLGFKSCYVGAVTALHFESASRGHTPHPQDTALFIKRHADIIGRGDDYYGRFMDWYFPLPRFTFSYAKPFRFQVSRRNPARPSFEVAD